MPHNSVLLIKRCLQALLLLILVFTFIEGVVLRVQ